jgi:hypothetical protein
MRDTFKGLIVGLAIVVSSNAALAQTALPLGAQTTGKAADDKPAVYQLVAKTAGVVTVAVQGSGDLVLVVADEDGQPLQDGTSDRDLNGSSGTEQLAVTVTEPGTYQVIVRLQGGGAESTFQIAGAWLPFPAFARASADPDRRPGQARALKVGQPYEDGLDRNKGDAWDWYVFKMPSAGTFVVVTRQVGSDALDVVLEAFLKGVYSKAEEESDQDMQGNSAQESVSINVAAGDTVHIRVSSFGGQAGKYRISSNIVE